MEEKRTAPGVQIVESDPGPEAARQRERFDTLCRMALNECLDIMLKRKDCSLTAAVTALAAEMKYRSGNDERHYAPARIWQLRDGGHWSVRAACALAAAQSRDVDEMLWAPEGWKGLKKDLGLGEPPVAAD